jgi:hypothetical protein
VTVPTLFVTGPPVEDLLVQTEGRTVRELANEILAAAGWS